MSSEDDFDEPDFDSESSEHAVQKGPALNELGALYAPARQAFFKKLSLSVAKSFSQQPFDYGKMITQMVLREQVASAASQSVSTEVQTHKSSLTVSRECQAPTLGCVNGLETLLAANKASGKPKQFNEANVMKYVKDEVEQLSGSSAASFSFTLQKNQVIPGGCCALIGCTLLNSPGNEFSVDLPPLGEPRKQQLLNVSQPYQQLLVREEEAGVVPVKVFNPLDFCCFRGQLWVLTDGSIQIIDLKANTAFRSVPSKAYGIASNGQKVVAIEENGVAQFDGISGIAETYQAKVQKIFAAGGLFVAQMETGNILLFESASDIKTTKLQIRCSGSITRVEDGEGVIRVAMSSGVVQDWKVTSGEIEVVREALE